MFPSNGLNDEPKRSSHPAQRLVKEKERLLSPRGTETIKYPEKLKGENCFTPRIIHQSRERRSSGDARAVHSKAFESIPSLPLKGMATADEEMVRYMSNLPAYLQRIERGENFQEKVLNVGVLDWARLEKWKLNQKGDAKRGCAVAPSSTVAGSTTVKIPSVSSTLPSALSIKTPTRKSGSKGPLNSIPGSFHKVVRSQNLKSASNKAMHGHDYSAAAKLCLDRDNKILSASSTSGRNISNVNVCEREKSNELGREMGFNAVKFSILETRSTGAKDALQKRGKDGRNLSEVGASSISELSRSGEQRFPPNGEMKDRIEKAQESDVAVFLQPGPRKQKNIVPLLPTRYPMRSPPNKFKRKERYAPSASCSTVLNRSSFSDSISSDGLHSKVIHSQVPIACPLPSQVEAQGLSVPPTVERASDASPAPSSNLQISGPLKSAGKHESNSVANLDVAAELKTGGLECPEGQTRRSRNSSPVRRFSFSLGRMTKSFSFKETASVPQLAPTYVSAKSGPVTKNDTPCGHISNQEKVNSSTRGRSSPLRRLFDPLLKLRSMKTRHSGENVQIPKPMIPLEPLQNEKHMKCMVQALLQLTVKNGNHFFKFVVDNNSNVLAATVSDTVSGRKDGSFRSCTFYSVNEIKKKSISWISQSIKGKSGDFEYNAVGQMKLPSPFSDWTMKSLNQRIITTECVLFSVDSKQADKQPASSVPSRELAAIVIKFSASENCESNSVTVILPGGVHGVPAKGEPSPLIERWKSGGSCDCGGWDVGCKAHVLSNENSSLRSARASKTPSTPDHLELYPQEGAQSSRPTFSLAPFKKDIYSVEFDSSISLLQAFSISVAFMSCQQPPPNSPLDCLFGANMMREPTFRRNAAPKVPPIFQREGPARYTPCPPLSPVGRV